MPSDLPAPPTPSSVRAAAPAGARADVTQRALLQSIVEAARVVFGATAASVLLVDADRDELVFEAVAGEGEEHLIGTRFPADTGIAGWVATSGLPLMADDVADSPQFALDAAESTGYVPRSLMAAPVMRDGDCIGVLEVLDRGTRPRGDLADVDLLGLLATELGLALELLVRHRWTRDHGSGDPADGDPDSRLLSSIAERLPTASGPAAATAGRLLAVAEQLLIEDASVSDAVKD
jgi:GAF domain-containing protein